MLPYVEYTLELLGTNILNQSGLKSQFKFELIETHGIKSQPKLEIMARPTVAIGSEAIFETVLYPICGEPIEDDYNNLQVKYILRIYNDINIILYYMLKYKKYKKNYQGICFCCIIGFEYTS